VPVRPPKLCEGARVFLFPRPFRGHELRLTGQYMVSVPREMELEGALLITIMARKWMQERLMMAN
jgi:hypothetical protein